jgi:F-type H+-transporting ATPase subunit delta
MTATLSAESGRIAGQYAKALFDSADETQSLDAVLKDLQSYASLYHSVPELPAFLTNPSVRQDEKLDFIAKSITPTVHPLVSALAKLLVEQERNELLPAIAKQYENFKDQREGVTTAQVTTAVPLPEHLATRLQASLQKLYGFETVHLNTQVDPDILGGVVVRIQDHVIDGSLKGKLETIRKQVGLL